MSARLVITRNMRGGVSYSLEYGPKNFQRPKSERLRRIEIELTPLGEKVLRLDSAANLFECGLLRDNPMWHLPDPPKIKAEEAKAFAKYRESRQVWPVAHPEDFTLEARARERERIRIASRNRGNALKSVGDFCLELGRRVAAGRRDG